MIVTCERCATQFQLDDARVPKQGVRVRCSRCKHAFRVVPGGTRSAEPAAEAAQAAREKGDDSTQDIAGEAQHEAASGLEAGERDPADEPRTASGFDAETQPEAGERGPGLESEESDWEFNQDVAGEIEQSPQADLGSDDSKPDPPDAAPAPRSGGRLADDWFGGSAADAPLELDDRPRGGSEEAEPEAHERSAPAAAARESVSAAPREAAPVLAAETPAPQRAEVPTAHGSADELSNDAWDLLAATEEEERAPVETQAPPPSRGRFVADAAARLLRWLAQGGHALGWAVTLGLFGAGLFAGLAPQPRVAPHAERVAGIEVASAAGRFVDNASAGTLFVVSGVLRNPGPGAADLRPLTVELVDARGNALSVAPLPLHEPVPVSLLREAPEATLRALPRLAGEMRPGEQRLFEALVADLPAQAAAFRIVESRGTAPDS